MSKKLNYSEYLNLHNLLDVQNPKSNQIKKPVHDEMLFIIIHQTYELWFKQILHELDSIIKMFSNNYVQEENLGLVIARFDRIIEIQKLLVNQISILETMTPMDFLEFRDLLTPSSGFQSVQFRLIENKLGMIRKNRIKYGNKSYNEFVSKKESQILKSSENHISLFKLLEEWLERTPFLQMKEFDFWKIYSDAVKKMISSDIKKIKKNNSNKEILNQSLNQYESIKITFDALFSEKLYKNLQNEGKRRLSQKATLAALFIQLYRDEPILQLPHRLINQLINLDQLLTSWRNRHKLLVFRMIGIKIGTGGSSGHKYLKETAEKHSIFDDFSNLSSYIIPRSALPELPNNLKKELGFYFTYEK